MRWSGLYLILVLWSVTASVLAQPGFISIDCGLAGPDTYKDNNGITYVSDAGFINTGQNYKLPNGVASNYFQHYTTVRSFPNGSRNCYTFKPVTKGNKYLIRASFFYGNYDQRNRVPEFDLYVGVNRWATISNVSRPTYYEIIIVTSLEYIFVCLQNIGMGTPFISALELRLLRSSMYTASNELQSLVLYSRVDTGSSFGMDIRYPDDSNDLMWRSVRDSNWSSLRTSLPVLEAEYDGFQPPSKVMMTAVTPAEYNIKNSILSFSWSAEDPTLQFHVYRFFSEIERLAPNMTREFSACCTGVSCFSPVRLPGYLHQTVVYTITPISGQRSYVCSFQKTQNSTLPPILNAYEIYAILPLSLATTNAEDVNVMSNIGRYYNLKKIWMGDPCLPKDYPWEGLTCNYPDDASAPTIKSLNLSSSGLNGEIAAFFAILTSIEALDLSGNNLSGPVPGFLGDLRSLSCLNLSGNQLSGSIPSNLLERLEKGLLKLSVENNPALCSSGPCSQNKKKNIVAPVAASLGSAVITLLILTALWIFKWKKQDGVFQISGSLRSDNRRFTYADLVNMTNNFARTLGKGGSGVVYYGEMRDETQVAVKILSVRSQPSQGPTEFLNEAQLLMRIHHKNLLPFIGYCHEGDKMALIYEYMAQGNLASHLSGITSNAEVLSWNQRLRIALNVAQGLEYLHNGCKPPIIHRDMKTTNILLDDRLEPKIGDFGLSKSFVNEKFSHISTGIKGTHGYLDPEYCCSQNLTEKSDVFSFGVILLEIITGQPAIIKISDSEPKGLIGWANSMVAEGDIRRVIDPRLGGNYNVNSVWKAVETAMACTETRSIDRPTMTDVVAELMDCLGTELATDQRSSQQGETSSMLSFYPSPR